MKTHINFFLYVFFPFYILGQSNTFHSNLDKQFTNAFVVDKVAEASGTNHYLRIKSRFFGSGSFCNKGEFYNTYLVGLNLEAKIKRKFLLTAFYDHLDGRYNHEIKNYQDSLRLYYPGFGINNNRFQFNIKYLANKFIVVDLGYGKQFIGDGHQSLLLSNVASSFPYLKLTTKFGPVRYYNLYTTFINPNMVDYGRKKHATIHYLDFAVTKKIHLGIYESILWQSKSENANNGYELAYFNPVIFYRPVEFSKQSNKGNALMGVNLNAMYGSITFYGQFMLDDLNISRQKDRDDNYEGGFFQNKYAYQLGLKGKMKNVKFLIEYNVVQPYAYGHRTILQNYSHMNQALAHPLGANFKELINILEVNQGRWSFKIKTIFANVGLDSIGTHFGQNIFESDLEASTGGQYSYGNFNGQGVSTDIFSFQSEVSYSLKWFDIFGSFYCRKKESTSLDQSSFFYSIGLRNFPFSTFYNY